MAFDYFNFQLKSFDQNESRSDNLPRDLTKSNILKCFHYTGLMTLLVTDSMFF